MNQMQGMLTDYLAVKEENKEFESFVQSSPSQEIAPNSTFDFSIQCLKTANWPAYKAISLVMPPHIDDKFQQYNRFYKNKHQRRKITIQFSLGDAIVAMYTPDKPKPHDLRVSTLAMFVLLLFNDPQAQSEGLTMKQIMNALSIDDESCKKTLQSLATTKFRIITRETSQTPAQS